MTKDQQNRFMSLWRLRYQLYDRTFATPRYQHNITVPTGSL